MQTQPMDDLILSLCQSAGSGKTICPTDAAKAFAHARGDTETGAWQRWLTDVRRTAVRLAVDHGSIVVYRKGKPADPHDFRGVYRLGLPRLD